MKLYDNVEVLLAYHGAPTLEGIKPASLISFNKQRIKNCRKILRDHKTCLECKGLHFFILSETTNWLLLLLYREKTISQLLADEQNRKFLNFYGYNNCRTLTQYLRQLRVRMTLQKGFPHEIGVFLGYPLEDVRGFIENNGKHFKMAGQWKVYSDTERAEKLFAKYAECSDRLCSCIMRGQSIEELAKIV